jgi:hypothetical protein
MKKIFTTLLFAQTLKKELLLLFLGIFAFGDLSAQTREVVLTTGTSWTPPCGVTSITVQLWGGGGGGAGDGATTASTGGGGGSGAYRTGTIAVTPGTAVTYALGAGGAGGCGGGGGCPTAGGPGAAGGTTSIGTISAGGGSGGAANNGIGGAGGTGTGGTGGANGNAGSTGANNASGEGGNAPNAGVGTVGSGVGGASVTADGNGNVGTTPGGGGSGANNSSGGANSGGAGAAGRIRITYTGPFAGSDIVTAACATSATLAANSPAGTATGTWTRTSGPNTPTFSSATSSAATISGLVAGTYVLRWTWTGGGAGCTSLFDEVTVIVPQGPGCWIYCTPAGNLNCGAGDYISKVIFNTINRSSLCDPGGYINTGLNTTVNIGQIYDLTVHNGTYGSGRCGAYIDWNNNGAFEAAEFYTISTNMAANTNAKISITVPADAAGGSSVRMRIRYFFSTAVSSTTGCTSSGTYGETEDYTIVITACTGTCSDGIQNCGETGVDCGGPCAAACAGTATCSDNIQNQGETGVDCGGPCPACGARCATITNSSQTGIPEDGIIDLSDGGSAVVNTCMTFTYSNTGSNWVHGVFMNPAVTGFVSSAGTGTPPVSIKSAGTDYTWLAITNNFTSQNSGTSITADGWYIETVTSPINPGNNLGYPKGANTSIGPFCFNTTLACGTLTGDNPGTLQFGISSDSYSGSWTNTACGLEFSAAPNTFPFILKCPVILPISLLSFDGELVNQKVNLKWSTLSEINNDYFVIQRSTNAKDYFDIGTVKGSGNSNVFKEYSFVDDNPSNGNNYYRLKQVDFDGEEKVVRVIAVSAVLFVNQINKIYPNPVKNSAEIILATSYENEAQIRVFDAMGKLIYQDNKYLVRGENAISLNLTHLAKGIYSVAVTSNSELVKAKFIKE